MVKGHLGPALVGPFFVDNANLMPKHLPMLQDERVPDIRDIGQSLSETPNRPIEDINELCDLKASRLNLRQEKGVTLQDTSMLWAFHHKPVIQVYGGTL